MAHPTTIERFTIVRPLGTGGMGTVYEAVDPKIDRRVAIKVLRRDVLADNPEFIERLWVEARAANSIRHPGVVQISEARLLEDGTGFLVMELLEGPTLTQRMKSAGGQLPLVTSVQIAAQIASTLSAGHRQSIIHRDLKPDNVMLVPDDAVSTGERVKLLDFGIAKISRAALSRPLTLVDMGLGTPGYMAPEQIRGAASASDRSDVYGLGAVLFEMLSGRRPHVAANTADLVVLVLSQDAPSLGTFVEDLPPALDKLVQQMLAREPAARPPMSEVLRELMSLAVTLLSSASVQSGGGKLLGVLGQAQTPGRSDPADVPPTMVRPASGAKGEGARGPLPLSAELAETTDGEPASVLPPSASTLSRATGQTEAPHGGVAAPAAKRTLAGAALAAIAIGALRWGVRGRLVPAPRPIVSAPPMLEAAPQPGPIGDAPSERPVRPEPREATPVAQSDKQAPAASPDTPVSIPSVNPAREPSRHPKPAVPDASCIQGRGLSPSARRDIAAQLAKADIRLLPNEEISLMRQANSLTVRSAPQGVRLKQQIDIERLLARVLSSTPLPERLQEVLVRCAGN